jgi:hypothetical protein
MSDASRPDQTPVWPLRVPQARPVALGAIVIGALVTAVVVPLNRPGLGWLLAGIAVAAALLVAAGPASGPERPRAAGRGDRVAWAIAGIALLGVGTVRAAGWLFVLCVLAAGVAGVLAVGRPRTVIGILMSAPVFPAAVARAAPWAARSATAVFGRREQRRAVLGTAAAILVGVVLVVIFGALFASADPAFAKFAGMAIPDIDLSGVVPRMFIFGFVGAGMLASAFLLVNPTTFGESPVGLPRPLRRVEVVLPGGALIVLFGSFVAVQAAVLFGGKGYVLKTADLTVAEYARRGFWQLLMVSLLALAVLAVVSRWAPRASGPDRVLLRVQLCGLAGLSLVVVASALYRMWVYEQAYGFTRLRITVSVFELWLGVLFLLVGGSGIRLGAAWLPRAVIGTGLVVLFGLAVLNPDRFIAARNIDRFERTGRIDVVYLGELSADAAEELGRLPSDRRVCALRPIARQLDEEPDGVWEYNAARSTARSLRLPDWREAAPSCASRY